MTASSSARSFGRTLMRHRSWMPFVANIATIATAYVLAFLLRFDFVLPPAMAQLFLETLVPVIVIEYAAFHALKFTRGSWRYVGVADLVTVTKAAVMSAMVQAVLVLMLYRAGYPRSVIIMNAILLVGLSIGLRLVSRGLRRNLRVDEGDTASSRLLIIGAGDTGETLLREIRQSPRLGYRVVAFLDDDEKKWKTYLNGVPVLDSIDAAKGIVQRYGIDEIIVASPSASGDDMRRIIACCREAGVPFKVMPATYDVLRNRGLDAARLVDINDLLRRPPVELDRAGIDQLLRNKRVLVTGAAGSIGSELARQVATYKPSVLLCLDHDENALFFLQRELRELAHDVAIRFILADVTDPGCIDAIFRSERPQIVYHAAAHKHVPVIEENAVEGVRNNVFGTEIVARAAGRYESEGFVLISTDKAVNPTSVMGTTKRVSELLIQTLPFQTRYTAVRFGNVLGSQGSVVPILKEQIARGGPVTVTHPDMRRYFMTIPEAVELVIQTSAMAESGRVYMLDMGDPVKIVDLARDLITLSGHRPDHDIRIVFTGTRPGEKLYEELYLDAEESEKTRHEKIFAAKHNAFDRVSFGKLLVELRETADKHDESSIRRVLLQLVPEYTGGSAAGASNVIPLRPSRPDRAVSRSPQ